jgi:hypothetical protein
VHYEYAAYNTTTAFEIDARQLFAPLPLAGADDSSTFFDSFAKADTNNDFVVSQQELELARPNAEERSTQPLDFLLAGRAARLLPR